MKIALLGFGKMGKRIAEIATHQGHEVIVKINSGHGSIDFRDAEVAIDFSTPEVAPILIKKALLAGLPVVSGTTGWLEKFEEITQICNTNKGTLLYASNFSLGVNVFFKLNEYLAQMMGRFKSYNIELTEIHHIEKKDAPGGTALSLAQDICASTKYSNWTLDSKKQTDSTMLVKALREGAVPGTHLVEYKSETDTIYLKHEAHSRDGFAQGALIAAAWVLDKKGIYSMQDVLDKPINL
jgi:4-hydroxy-tetrahydrodipicolinate reductase